MCAASAIVALTILRSSHFSRAALLTFLPIFARESSTATVGRYSVMMSFSGPGRSSARGSAWLGRFKHMG